MFRSVCLILACAAATSVSAQTPVPEPSGLGGDAGRSAPRKQTKEPPQTMMLTFSFSGAATDESGATTDIPTMSGIQTDAGALFIYQRRAGRAKFGANAGSVVRSGSGGDAVSLRHQGDFDFSWGGPRTQVHTSQSASYSPDYQFGAIPLAAASSPGQAIQSRGDFANTRLTAYGSATDIGLSRAISSRSTLSFSYGLRHTMFDRPEFNLTSQSIGVRLTRRLTRYASLRTGYGYRVADSALTKGRPTRDQDLDLGFDYNRSLSFSRRTVVSFSSGSSAVTQEGQTAFRLTGAGTLTHQMGRTWSAQLGLNRGVQLLEGFAQPVLSNVISAGLNGSLGRRTRFTSSAAFTTGDVGLSSGGANNYSNWTTGVGLQVALSRSAALETQYFHYSHRFGDDVLRAPGLTTDLRKQGLRVSVTWRAPLRLH